MLFFCGNKVSLQLEVARMNPVANWSVFIRNDFPHKTAAK